MGSHPMGSHKARLAVWALPVAVIAAAALALRRWAAAGAAAGAAGVAGLHGRGGVHAFANTVPAAAWRHILALLAPPPPFVALGWV